jgi:hypothetical protein
MTTEQKNALISEKFLQLIESGMNAREAFEQIFGEGSWKVMAGMVWESFRAQSKA